MSNNNFAETLASVASEFDSPHRKPRPSKRPYFRWTDEQLEQLATLRDEGKSANEIAEALGVSSDKVVTKLAAMAARERAGSKEPEKSAETVAEQTAEVEQEPTDDEDILVAAPVPKLYVSDEAFDRMIFTAFDAVVGRVDDFNKMAACWRRALSVIEQEIRKLSYIVEQHPNTEESVCQIAAIIAYDEVRA
jgi:hypothetical protein